MITLLLGGRPELILFQSFKLWKSINSGRPPKSITVNHQPMAQFFNNIIFDQFGYGKLRNREAVENFHNASYEGLPWIPKEAFYRLSDYYEKDN